ncbi:MAG: DUF4238 domain-containing protein [Geobacteraceae bacterium]|nr:DUF4238 domain-containing protein [Geobacteraceae bacterium]
MPNNKKHHYVPQFYLRNFSEDSKSISLFNLKREEFYNGAPIKTQCYKDYFYGEDGEAERALCHFETKSAQIIREIIGTHNIPSSFTSDHVTLSFFINIQSARTQGTADEYDEMTDRFAKHLFLRSRPEGITAEDIAKVKISLTNAVGESLRNAVQLYPLLLDLDLVLLLNVTNEAFITSDNPVVMYNQLLEERSFASNTGIQSVGLQIFFPLSPSCMILLLDRSVYGFGRRNQRVIQINKVGDVEQLNNLQFLAAVENIYFHQQTGDTGEISRGFRRVKRLRRPHKTNLHSQVEKLSDTKEKELIGMYREDIRCDLKLSFIKLMPKAKQIKEDVMYRIACRDQGLVDEFHRFGKLVKRGYYGTADFLKYLAERG